MKWAVKRDPVTKKVIRDVIISDCGRYQITKFTCGGVDLFLIYQGGNEIGSAENGNQARRIAERHKGAA
ncbi:hypothetical protein [Vreelandella populi]|uniref:hypothetical protein n=1 Tax=Vreelandella populi TaxID=2498858 RepID=UPI000F8EEF46|nr:hypothetical protein [Halomonas populi]RUR38526.1 hypothetical protein ELY25_09185 [Halomonas populi]